MALTLKIVPWGPTQATVTTLLTEMAQRRSIKARLDATRNRFLRLKLVDEEKTARPTPPKKYRAITYDYTNNQTVQLEGSFDDPQSVEISELGRQPLPNADEFDAAVQILRNDPRIGPAISQGQVQPFRPMPPLIEVERPDGRTERTLAVGLAAKEARPRHRIVGVNMINETVLSDPPNVPSPSSTLCGPPAMGGCESTGTSGQVKVTVSQGATVLWEFVVLRPAVSSGVVGSGVELRHVFYKGKQVLYRAHVPILNVEYFEDGIADGCGPVYRDWQNQENCFEAKGADAIPGYRQCTAPAKTILETESDAGNFQGVAIYVQNQEVIVVSEMAAGWYRYISRWSFNANGNIRPRFGFAAIENKCTCHKHHHHVYWRMDFDINTASKNVFEEFNSPPLGPTNWSLHKFEVNRQRDASHKRKWRVRNTATNSGYVLIPGLNDGNATSFGVGDIWAMRYRSTELDDGQGYTEDPTLAKAHLDKFIANHESIENQDVVVWYAAHFLHDEEHGEAGGHIVGPELRPFNW
ncbi:MAG TPA: hypothetical protein VF708_06680 [Pyrinomonadaceae bacterium]|jgi:hypothetical protein